MSKGSKASKTRGKTTRQSFQKNMVQSPEQFLKWLVQKDVTKLINTFERIEIYCSDLLGDGNLHVGEFAPDKARENVRSYLGGSSVKETKIVINPSMSVALVAINVDGVVQHFFLSLAYSDDGFLTGFVCKKVEKG